MELSAEESSKATPREVDLFVEEALEEVFETIDSLRAQFDQLQIHCEKLAAEKAKVDQLLIDKETECQLMKERLQEDISNLRKVNLQLIDLQEVSSKGMRHFCARKEGGEGKGGGACHAPESFEYRHMSEDCLWEIL